MTTLELWLKCLELAIDFYKQAENLDETYVIPFAKALYNVSSKDYVHGQ